MAQQTKNSKGRFMSKRCLSGFQNIQRYNALRSDDTGVKKLQKNSKVDCLEGRRIVELKVLAENLGSCSGRGCNLLQDLSNCESETRRGFMSILYIRCQCGYLNAVHTGNRVKG